MDERILKWLFDIQIAIDEIDGFFLGKERDFNEYKKNLMLKRAVERNLEIIGEAVNRIIKKQPDFPISDSYLIIGTRNRIIHGYDVISDDLIWSILENNLPKLKNEVSQLLGE